MERVNSMIDKEKLHQILSSLWKNDDSVGKMCYNQALQDVQIAIDTMKEEPISKDLGEYINELSKQFQEVSFAKLSRIAVRVAKWQKEQMMTKAIDGTVRPDDNEIWCNLASSNLKDGDKVKVLVIKED